MNQELQPILQKLMLAVETALDSNVEQQARFEAYQLCEEFKESSPYCAQCALLLADKEHNHVIRHFGLQLLEHCIKYKWNAMSTDDKVFIKENSMNLLASGTWDILKEEAHIKDALSRIIVEMVKREWPQHWPLLLKELNEICQIGDTQKELSLLVLLRLVEDVVVFHNVPSQRRRDIYQALTANMADLMTFFITILQTSTSSYHALKDSPDEASRQQSLAHCKVAHAALTTLAGYVDWIDMSHVMTQNGLVLQMLCLLLSDHSLHLPAAECLLLIVSRKGKVEERKPLLILFNEDAMSAILNAAVAANSASYEEKYYLFLKKLCQVLTAIGAQLCALWGSSEDVSQPQNFSKFLESILAFTQHHSQVLSSYTYTLWASFLRHEHISQDPILKEVLPRIVQSATTTLMKVGIPSMNNHPSCAFSKLDFDGDDEFNQFFHKYRGDVAGTLRLASLQSMGVTYMYASQWLRTQMTKPIELGDGSEGGHCNLSSPSFLEWDALTVFLESVMSKFPLAAEPKPAMMEGVELLRSVLNYDTKDPLILSCVLSCISALFIFITHAPDILATVLDKIFAAAVFSLDGQTKSTRSKAVKNVRRHACSVLVKMCKEYPQLLLPGFEQLYMHIKSISSDPGQLSQMEKCTLYEALILISNQFKNYERQSAFLQEILAPVREIWLSAEFKEAFWNTDKFMHYIGVDQAPVEPSSADTCGINRSHISYCINIILAVMKRSKWPDSIEAAIAGGFMTGEQENGVDIKRNPVTPQVHDLLPNLFALIRTLNSLWLPENLAKRHPDFLRAYDLQEAEKLAVFGKQPPLVDNTSSSACKQPLARMQNFITNTHDNSYHILGNAGQCLGKEFYTFPSLADSMLQSVFTNLDLLPDYRLRPIIRVFMKPFVQSCPKECYSIAVLPLLGVVCPYLLQRLGMRWQIIKQRCEDGLDNDEENAESQEVLEDQLTTLLTRDYMELLGSLCLSRRGEANAASDEQMVEEDESSAPPPQQQNPKEVTLSELGQLVLRTEATCPAVIMCAFSGLAWSDTTTCSKCINLCWPMLKQLLADKKVTGPDAGHLFTSILLGLQQHGQHEGYQAMLLGLGLQSYEAMCPLFPEIHSVLSQIPECSEKAVKVLDERIMPANPQKMVTEKKKKEAFKKVVEGVIGKNVSQQFRKDVHIKNLPPLLKNSRPKNKPVEEAGLCALFAQEGEN